MTGKFTGGSCPENRRHRIARQLRNMGPRRWRRTLRSILSMGAISAVVATMFIGGAVSAAATDPTNQAVEPAIKTDEPTTTLSTLPSENTGLPTPDSTRLAQTGAPTDQPTEADSAPATAQPEESTVPVGTQEPSARPETQPKPVKSVAPSAAAPEATEESSSKKTLKSSERTAARKSDSTPTAKESEPTAPSEAPESESAKELGLQLLAPAAVVGGFEIDGNKALNGTGSADWSSVTPRITNDGFKDSTQLGGKENNPATWVSSGASASGKTDIGDVFTYNQVVAGNQYFYLAITRQDGTGSVGYRVELNQVSAPEGQLVPIRTNGDIMLSIGQGGNDPFEINGYQEWTNGAWVEKPRPTNSIEGESNAAASEGYAAGTFMEASFNLTALNQNPTCTRGTFTQINIRSRASNTGNPDLEDRVQAPVSIPPRCADIDIEKRNEAGQLVSGATFRITPNPLTGTGSLTVADGSGNDADGTANGVIKLRSNYFAGPLSIEETIAPQGYLLPAPADRTKSVTASAYGTYSVIFVDPKPYKPLTVEKSAAGGYEVEYTWDIDKSVAVAGEDVDGEQVPTAGDTAVDFDYSVAVEPLQRIVRDVLVSGEITVDNPNDRPMVATLEDELADGTACIISATDMDADTAGLQVELPSGESTFGYECTAEEEPAELTGSNEATVTWDLGDYPQTQGQLDDPANAGTGSVSDIQEFDYAVTEINKTITVLDDQHDFAAPGEDENGWMITWGDPEDNLSRSYTLEHQGEPGTCTEFSNTASVEEIPEVNDSTLVTLCSGADLLVSSSLDLSLEREYLWDIDKKLLSDEPLVFDQEGKATAEYEVIVTPGTPVDRAWTINGTVSVNNPNNWQDVQVHIAQPTFSGLSTSICTITETDGDVALEGFQAVIPSSATVDFSYECTVDAQPDYSGTSGAVVTWDEVAASTMTGQGAHTATTYAAGDWEITKRNETVTVLDDHHDFDPAWSITYQEGVVPPPRSYEVSWAYEQSDNLCNEFTNIAQLFGDDPETALDEDSVTVTGCLPADLTVDKTSDPVSGSYVAPGSIVNYTLTFTNDGGVPAEVNYSDWLTDVLDDATYNNGSLQVQGEGLTASITDGKIALSGEVAAQDTVTVTYAVTIKTKDFGNGVAANFLMPDGEEPPGTCDPEVTECTEHPILGTVNWAKTDEAGDPLAQSEWELSGPDDFNDGAPMAIEDCIAAESADCTGADRDPAGGQFTVVHLPWGNYELKETKAPAGYYPMADPLAFEIIDGDLVIDLAGIENLRRESPMLPLTGGLGRDLYFLLGGSVAAMGAVAYWLMKWRRRHSSFS